MEKRNPSTWMEQRELDKGPVVTGPALSLLAGRGQDPGCLTTPRRGSSPLQRGRGPASSPSREGRGDEGLEPPSPWQGLHGGALCPPCHSANRSGHPQVQLRMPRAQRLRRCLKIRLGDVLTPGLSDPDVSHQPLCPRPSRAFGDQAIAKALPSTAQLRWRPGYHTRPCPHGAPGPPGPLRGLE